VNFYCCTNWTGTPKESEEMKPRWFSIDKIPYSKMWPDDQFWLPLFFDGKMITGRIVFGQNDEILQNSIRALEVFGKTKKSGKIN